MRWNLFKIWQNSNASRSVVLNIDSYLIFVTYTKAYQIRI